MGIMGIIFFVKSYYFEYRKLTKKKTKPSINIPISSKVGTKTTRLLVYQGKALNVPTAPYSISNLSWESKILKNYTFCRISKINCENSSPTKLIRPIS